VVRLPSQFQPEQYALWRKAPAQIQSAKHDCLKLIEEFKRQLGLIRNSDLKLNMNLSKDERIVLKSIKKVHPNLTFVEADKDCAIVILTISQYVDLCYEHLNDTSIYKKLGELKDVKL
jgi:hypothetical protein